MARLEGRAPIFTLALTILAGRLGLFILGSLVSLQERPVEAQRRPSRAKENLWNYASFWPAMEVVERIRQRVLLEVFDLDPVVEPAPPRSPWPEWSEADKRAVKLRVLSLNAWGLPVAPKCTERAGQIASAIESDFELVVLQEIWHIRERNLIISRAQEAGFDYYHYFNPAVGFPFPLGADGFGTGLLVLSKFPISSAQYHSFSLSGRPYALHEADFVANKGAGLLRVETPVGQIDVYVTHLLANYNDLGKPGPGDFYQSHRTGQSYELTQFIAATNRNALTVVCGDFNSSPDCLELRLPRQLVRLRDAFSDTNSKDGLTFATPDNKYSHGEHPMRMDYVLYKIAKPEQSEEQDARWQLVNCDVYKGFFEDAKGEKTPLSDHNGVRAEFVFGAPQQTPHPCEQQDGFAVVSSTSELSPPTSPGAKTGARSCLTTTCSFCDDRDDALGKNDASRLAEDTETLREVQELLEAGRKEAVSARLARLWRAIGFFVASLSVCLAHVFSVVESNWSWVAVLALALIGVVEYVLVFFYITFECSTFTELSNEVRLHQHQLGERTRKLQ